MVSDMNRSFRIDDIESQYNQQMVLINGLKHEIKSKQEMIEAVNSKSENLQRCKVENLEATISDLTTELKQVAKEKEDAVHDFQVIAEEWQTMESNIDDTFKKKESLEKELKNMRYWIDYIVEYLNQRINGTDDQSMYQVHFESVSNDIPKELDQLHNSLIYILRRMHLSDLNETTCEDINDDAVLEEIFGPIPECEESMIEVHPINTMEHKSNMKDAQEDTQESKEKLQQEIELENAKQAQESLERSVNVLEAEVCLEHILHKVELQYVGNEAETLIAAYQNRMKTYLHFIKQLKDKVAESSKLVHTITLERDHSWKQLQNSQKKLIFHHSVVSLILLICDPVIFLLLRVQELTETNEKLQSENESLETSILRDRQDMETHNQKIEELVENYRIKTESIKRQLNINEQSNVAMQQRLHESTAMVQELTKQLDELQQEYVLLSEEFTEYREDSSMLFKVCSFTF